MAFHLKLHAQVRFHVLELALPQGFPSTQQPLPVSQSTLLQERLKTYADFSSAPSSPGSQDGGSTALSYSYLLKQARLEKKQNHQHSDPFMLIMEGYTSSMPDDRVQGSMLYSTAADSRAERGGGIGGLDSDDTAAWMQRQQALHQRWREEDAAATKDILTVADKVQHRIKQKLAHFKSHAAAQQDELQRQEAAAAKRKQQEEEAAKLAEEQAAVQQAAQAKAAEAAAAAAAQAEADAAQKRLQDDTNTAHQAVAPDVATSAPGDPKKPLPVAAGASEAGAHVQVSKRAWEAYQKRLKVLEGLTSGNEDYKKWAEQQRAMKVTERDTRKISRALNAIINGLAGTQEDVTDKFHRVRSELEARSGPARTEVVVQFARKVVNQCAEMVAKSPQYAWPLAALVAQVVSLAPELLDVLLAVMHMGAVGCALSVPMYITFKVAGNELSVEQWRDRNGYREDEEEADFLMRMSGTLRLLGALWVNLDLAGAWGFVAAMLNTVPPNRVSACALLAFLETTGNSLCAQYGQQAFKLLQYIEDHWIPALEKVGQATAAERSQLRLFCSQGYRDVPEGSQLVDSVQDVEASDSQEKHRGGGRSGGGYRGGYNRR